MIVRSESLRRVIKLAEKVARHPAAVLIVGETGTGKENTWLKASFLAMRKAPSVAPTP